MNEAALVCLGVLHLILFETLVYGLISMKANPTARSHATRPSLGQVALVVVAQSLTRFVAAFWCVCMLFLSLSLFSLPEMTSLC